MRRHWSKGENQLISSIVSRTTIHGHLLVDIISNVTTCSIIIIYAHNFDDNTGIVKIIVKKQQYIDN